MSPSRFRCSVAEVRSAAAYELAADWLSDRPKATIARTVGQLLGGSVELSFEVLE